jgi:outer membrane protein assembly factor BamB
VDEDGNIYRDGDMRKAYSTPFVTTVGGEALLVNIGSFAVFGYDARTGREIWKMSHGGYSPSTSPIVAGGFAYATTGYEETELRAIRMDGEGDVTDSHVAWSLAGERMVPYTPSPIFVDGLLYIVSDGGGGRLSCLDAETGAVVWEERLGGNYQASPVYADGRLYFFNAQGKATVLAPGRTFKKLAENELESGFWASPAVAGGSIYVRSKTHLYRIADPKQ